MAKIYILFLKNKNKYAIILQNLILKESVRCARTLRSVRMVRCVQQGW